MTPCATRIYQRVLEAMQPAEELGGPEGDESLALMHAISTEVMTRQATYLAHQQDSNARPPG